MHVRLLAQRFRVQRHQASETSISALGGNQAVRAALAMCRAAIRRRRIHRSTLLLAPSLVAFRRSCGCARTGFSLAANPVAAEHRSFGTGSGNATSVLRDFSRAAFERVYALRRAADCIKKIDIRVIRHRGQVGISHELLHRDVRIGVSPCVVQVSGIAADATELLLDFGDQRASR